MSLRLVGDDVPLASIRTQEEWEVLNHIHSNLGDMGELLIEDIHSLGVEITDISPERLGKIIVTYKNSKDLYSTRTMFKEYEALILKLEKVAGEDPLTGLYSRRIFDRDLEVRCEKSDIHERRAVTDRRGHFSVILYDLNWFKQVNDTKGHQRGDQALKLLARRITKNIGKMDTAYRFGGDEFASIHPNTTPERAMEIAQMIYSKKHISIGISGSHVLREAGKIVTPKEIFRTADVALYKAKKNKKNSKGPVIWNLAMSLN